MRIIRNKRHIRAREIIGRYMPWVGIATLAIGWFLSFREPAWLTPMLVSLPVGVGLSMLGGFFNERYVGPLAHHDALTGALKGLDNQHVLLQYVLPVPHVLLEPGGCTVFVVKTQSGQVIHREEGRWKHFQRGKFFRQLGGQEALGAPDLEAERQVRKLGRWLTSHLPGVEVPVRAAIVFVNPNVTLDATASSVPAFYGKKVKAWLRGPGKLKPLPTDVHGQLTEALGINA
jgi:hypothetical protein